MRIHSRPLLRWHRRRREFGLSGSRRKDHRPYEPICTGGSTNPAINWSYDWTLIGAHDGSGAAQSGYIHGYGQSVMLAVEDYHNNGNDRRTLLGAATVGTTYSFRVQFVDSTNHEQEMIGNTVYQTTNFDVTVDWPTPWFPQWGGETEYQATTISGTSSSPAAFSSCDVQDPIDGFIGTANFSHPLSPTNTNGKQSVTTNTSFNIWSS